jgi:Na+-transporting NADH:ubiquinone oxidoreductase subunit F
MLITMEPPPNGKTITVNDGARTVVLETGRPLLYGLMSAGMYIPSACGGRGSCGQCRVRITDRVLPHGPAELPLVSEEDRRRGVHLSCQVTVADDLSIEIPARHLTARQYAAEVAGVRPLTGDITEIVLRLAGGSGFSFVPGQYIQVFIEGTENSLEPRYRAYSIASPLSSSGLLTLIVRRETGGTVSPYLCDRCRPGDTLAIRGPFGDFRLHDSSREILFVAGGSGMAPIRSLLLSMAEQGTARRAVYYFSARSARDLFLVEEMRELERGLPDFRFVPALSNPAPGEPWDGEKGGITSVLDRRLGSLDRHEAYLCGSAGMIDASIRVLRKKGLPEDLIFFDKFL